MVHPESSRRSSTSSVGRSVAVAFAAGLALLALAGPAQSADPPTRRGDFTADGKVDLTDAVAILNYLFQGGSVPLCLPLGDTDGNGTVDLTDAIAVLSYLFQGGGDPGQLTSEEAAACQPAAALSLANLQEKLFARTCAFSSCHSTLSHKGDLTLETLEETRANLVGVKPQNVTALKAGLLRVAAGTPDQSFLLRKLLVPRPGEGNRMPANSSGSLPVEVTDAVRAWIAAGAPLEGEVAGAPGLGDFDLPQTGSIPVPPVPENGLQVHLPPFTIKAGHEREIFWYAGKPFASQPADVWVKRIDIHMSEQSHHFIIYEWREASDPPAGVRDIGNVSDIITGRRFIVASQQSFFSLAFPEGVGIKFSKNFRMDLNSHYLNLDGLNDLQGEVYVNFFFADPGEITTEVKPIFDIDFFINVPPGATRTTSAIFPSGTQPSDPALGTTGRVMKPVHVYAISSHMHRHGTNFLVTRTKNGADQKPPEVVYQNDDWDDPLFQVFDPPLALSVGEGLRYATTHAYLDAPSPSSPPLTFGLTSEDEMAILLGYYAVP